MLLRSKWVWYNDREISLYPRQTLSIPHSLFMLLLEKLNEPQLRNDIALVLTAIGTIVSILLAFDFKIGHVLQGIAITCLFLGLIILITGRLKRHSPYTPWTPVVPPHFVGRDNLLRQLEEALDKRESISLVGDRRIGKTSILLTWQQQVQSRWPKRVVIFLDGQGQPANSLSVFINKITNKQGVDDAEGAADILSAWADVIKSQTQFPPLVLVDEAEDFIEHFPERFFERLRGMLGRVVWIFATHQEIDIVYKKYHTNTSPFENRLTLKWLGLLEPEAAAKIIRWGRFSAEEAQLLREWAGLHPFYLQLLGRHLQDAEGNVTVALDGFQMEAAKNFRHLWELLNDKEKQELHNCLTGSLATQKSLRVRGLVTEDGQLLGKVLKTWLEEQKTR